MSSKVLNINRLSKDLDETVRIVNDPNSGFTIIREFLFNFYHKLFDSVTQCVMVRRSYGIFYSTHNYEMLAKRYLDLYDVFEIALLTSIHVLKSSDIESVRKAGEISEQLLRNKLWKHIVSVRGYLNCCPEYYSRILENIFENPAPQNWDNAEDLAGILIEDFLKLKKKRQLRDLGITVFTHILSAVYPYFYPPFDKEVYCDYAYDKQRCENVIKRFETDYAYIKEFYIEILQAYRSSNLASKLPKPLEVENGVITKLKWNTWYEAKPVVHHLLAVVNEKR